MADGKTRRKQDENNKDLKDTQWLGLTLRTHSQSHALYRRWFTLLNTLHVYDNLVLCESNTKDADDGKLKARGDRDGREWDG